MYGLFFKEPAASWYVDYSEHIDLVAHIIQEGEVGVPPRWEEKQRAEDGSKSSNKPQANAHVQSFTEQWIIMHAPQ